MQILQPFASLTGLEFLFPSIVSSFPLTELLVLKTTVSSSSNSRVLCITAIHEFLDLLRFLAFRLELIRAVTCTLATVGSVQLPFPHSHPSFPQSKSKKEKEKASELQKHLRCGPGPTKTRTSAKLSRTVARRVADTTSEQKEEGELGLGRRTEAKQHLRRRRPSSWRRWRRR
jgi:hypothetical protein